MGWLGGLIGGGGNQLANVGQQVRGLLEQRRSHLADLLSQQAMQEPDFARSQELRQHAADLLAQKPMEGILPKLVKTIQTHFQGDHALGQMVGAGQGQATPPPTPGPATPGQIPGIGGGSAAQPPSSPVSPSQQGQSPSGPQAVSQPSTIGVGGVQPPVEATPQAAPAIPPVGAAPTPQNPTDAAFERIRNERTKIVSKYNAAIKTTAPALRKAVEDQMTAELQNLKPWEDQQMRQANLTALQSSPSYAHAPEWQKLAYESQAQGFQPVALGGMTRLMGVHQVKVDAGSMTEDEKIQYGIPPGAMGIFLADKDGMGNILGVSAPGAAGFGTGTDASGNQFQFSRNNPSAPQPIAAPGRGTAVNPFMARPRLVTGPHGEEFFASPAQAGNAPIPGAINPAFVPTTSNEIRSVQTQDAEGNPVTQFQPVQTSRSKGGATPPNGAVTPSAGVPPVSGGTPHTSHVMQFSKPFTPEQQMKGEQQLRQYNLALDRMQSIQSKLPLLNSLLESGKLNLEMDSTGFIKALVNRALPMTKSESEFVGDFRTMMEDINLLRGPMGATGFRGPEAWAALQAQRGQLLANPDITRQVLSNSIRALQGQQIPLNERFGTGKGKKNNPTAGSVPPVYSPNKPKHDLGGLK